MVVAMMMLAFSASAAQAPQSASVTRVSGDVKFAGSGSGAWSKLAEGDTLEEGSKIRTGVDGEVTLTWFSGNSVKVYPLTEITLESLSKSREGGEKTVLRLDMGKVLSKASKLRQNGSSFDLRTPVALAGVRGTGFLAEHDAAAGKSSFTVVEGSIAVSAMDVTVILQSEQSAAVMMNEPPSQPAPADPEIIKPLKDQFQMLNQPADNPAPEAGSVEAYSGENLIDDLIMQDASDIQTQNIMTPATGCCDY